MPVLGPIGKVVDRAHRDAVSRSLEDDSSRRANLNAYGKDFVRNNFTNESSLVLAIRESFIDLLNDEEVLLHLGEMGQARVISDYQAQPFETAEWIVSRLLDGHRIGLQKAVLHFILGQEGLGFCLKVQQRRGSAGRLHGRVPMPTSDCPGREDELQGIVDSLLRTPLQRSSIALCGPGGIGKTTLALNVLHHPRVEERYETYRFWINCELTRVGHEFLQSVLQSLSLSATLTDIAVKHADTNFANHLDRLHSPGRAAIVAFDNLETIFDLEPDLVEATIQNVFARASIMVTVRGQRRPTIGRVWSWPSFVGGEMKELPERAWIPALQAHAGREMSLAEVGSLRYLLQQVDGYPLGLFLLGRRLARGESTVANMSQAWAEEVSRSGSTVDSRLTCLETSLDVSLASPLMRSSAIAEELLTLAAYLPAGFPSTLEDSHDDEGGAARVDEPATSGTSVHGLPHWLALRICKSKDVFDAALTALTRCGLAYSSVDVPDRLQVLRPLREVLRRRRLLTQLSSTLLDGFEEAVEDSIRERPHSFNVHTARPSWRLHDQQCSSPPLDDSGEFARASLAQLEKGTSADQSQPADVDILAQSCWLLGLSCRFVGLHKSAKRLLSTSAAEWTRLGLPEKAAIARALRCHVEAKEHVNQKQYGRAAELYEEEGGEWQTGRRSRKAFEALARAACCRARSRGDEGIGNRLPDLHEEAFYWDKAARPAEAALVKAERKGHEARLAQRESRFGDAIHYGEEEIGFWEAAGRQDDVTWARAQTMQFRAILAEQDPPEKRSQQQLEAAASYREQEALLWELAQRPDWVNSTRAQAVARRAEQAEQQGRLLDAARYRNDEAALWTLDDEPENAACSWAQSAELRAKVAINNESLQEAIALAEQAASFWRRAIQNEQAIYSEAWATSLRAKLAKLEGRLEDALQFLHSEAALWDSIDYEAEAVATRAQAQALVATLKRPSLVASYLQAGSRTFRPAWASPLQSTRKDPMERLRDRLALSKPAKDNDDAAHTDETLELVD